MEGECVILTLDEKMTWQFQMVLWCLLKKGPCHLGRKIVQQQMNMN